MESRRFGRMNMASLAAALAVMGAPGVVISAPREDGEESDYEKRKRAERSELDRIMARMKEKDEEYEKAYPRPKKRAYSQRWTMRQGGGQVRNQRVKGPAKQPKRRKAGRSHNTTRSR